MNAAVRAKTIKNRIRITVVACPVNCNSFDLREVAHDISEIIADDINKAGWSWGLQARCHFDNARMGIIENTHPQWANSPRL
jgi:hypothetical protein